MKNTGIFSFLGTRFIHPLKEFLHDSRAIGVMLLSCTSISLLLSNIPFTAGYVNLWLTEIPFMHAVHLPHSIVHFINDGLMSVFFFLVGMEIRRELVSGELSSVRKSMLPIVAAVGGMLFPAVIYLLLNGGGEYSSGWAVPTATDIAFSLGVASLAGPRVPLALKIFLTALAIIDDLGAIIVIALFYGGAINFYYLIAAAGIAILTITFKRKTKRLSIPFIVAGLGLWYCMLNSGIHATIAGVLFAFLVPIDHVQRLEIKLHHSVYFLIMPLFALANTAIVFPANFSASLISDMSLGILLGLFVGKPLGITLMCLLLVKVKIAELPAQVNWLQMIGAGILAGIGFTMSIFIATLAFDQATADMAKISVLVASFLSIGVGYLWLRLASGRKHVSF